MSLQTLSFRFLPFLRWATRLDRQTFNADLMAGITGAAIIMPQGVAFATLAGMPPEYGLYAGMVPAVVAALFGSSRHLVSGPTTAASIVMFSALSTMAIPGTDAYITLAITLAFMVGCTQLLMGIARFGEIVNFISHSVIIGFTAGAATLIASKQAAGFFGLEVENGLNLYETLSSVITQLPQFHPMVTLVSLTTLLVAVFGRHLLPKFPAMLLAMIVSGLLAAVINSLMSEGAAGVEMVGALPNHPPPLSIPAFNMQVFQDLAPVALAMTLFALTEAVSISRSIALRSGQAISGNQEFIGQGLSNLFGSFFSAYVATGSFNRSAANFDAGARTPLAAVLAGGLLLLFIPFLAPLTEYMPRACVSGLLIAVAWRLIDFSAIARIVKADKTEAFILGVTFFATLLLDLEFALLLGVILSLMFYLRVTSRPKLLPRSPDPATGRRKFTSGASLPECPQLKILRLEDSLYFGSVAHVGELLRLYREHYPSQKSLFLLTKGVNQVDLAGAELLVSEARERRKMGGEFYMYQLKPSAMKVIERGFIDELKRENMFDSKSGAISTIFDTLDKSICRKCDKRIFLECDTVPNESEPPDNDESADSDNRQV